MSNSNEQVPSTHGETKNKHNVKVKPIKKTNNKLKKSLKNKNESSIEDVKAIHQNVSDYDCNQCKYKSSTKSNLPRHLERMHYKVGLDCFRCDFKTQTNKF